MGALDEDNITTDRRTRGKPIDYAEADGPGDDNSSESGAEITKEKKGAPTGPRTTSPQRKPGAIIDEGIEEEEDEGEDEYGVDDGGDEDEEDTDYDEDDEE